MTQLIIDLSPNNTVEYKYTTTVPRFLTARAAIKEIKELDPRSCLTLKALRRIINNEEIPIIIKGQKKLIDINALFEYLGENTDQQWSTFPRMRTIQEAAKELEEADNGTIFTQSVLRRLIKGNRYSVTKIKSKVLINMNIFEKWLKSALNGEAMDE